MFSLTQGAAVFLLYCYSAVPRDQIAVTVGREDTGITRKNREQNTGIHTEIDGMIGENIDLECDVGVK